MRIVKWAAVAVTALFVLMNLGVMFEPAEDGWARVVGAVLGVAGIGAVVGLAIGRPWGRAAVVTVGACNVAASVAGLFTGQEGSVIGVVVGGLGVLLGVFAAEPTGRSAATA